ncbi:MAG TPA: class I SAM-dependent methyltransferase [Candidatus Didemnitutus sp.]
MYAVNFRHRGRDHTVRAGEHFGLNSDQGFRDTTASDLTALVAEVNAGRPWREAVQERYATTKPWLHRIIAAPIRTSFLGAVLPAETSPVLDIGSGWGQVARVLAASRPVVALEPVAERLAFIDAAARQDGVRDRIVSVGADYLDVDFAERFSAICAIGVLEWAGAFQDREDPRQRQARFLEKTRRDLAPGGALVIGIENRIGLKYLLGCPDDHLGVAGIACLPAEIAARRWRQHSGAAMQSFTYNQDELEKMLCRAGYTAIEFFGAFPDYKVPEQIIEFGEAGATVNAWLREGGLPAEHNGYDGSPLAPELMETLAAHYRTFAEAGIGHHFVPSFFVRAR